VVIAAGFFPELVEDVLHVVGGVRITHGSEAIRRESCVDMCPGRHAAAAGVTLHLVTCSARCLASKADTTSFMSAFL
jgi:hypothetical protein